ncbi:hypothetical protein [Acidianus ambivalens]|uniref:Uncharacterized protein n=1 Tax=Acidianus ambivalens TaxID=2283 RepID=A0A650CVW1_ACIAM|nr:hypothetical protein [Acidianus ambivalens]MQL56360.1 hypothetical protein [Acidianus ambivalens]QGR22014.1 hypothetical protein D1866_08400 [Acidianus ambivalens]
MISKVGKLPIADKEFVKSWCSDFSNIVECIPSAIKSGNTIILELNSGIFRKKLKLNYYIKLDKNFFQVNFINEDNKLRLSIIIDDEPFFQIYYEGANENEFKRIMDEIGKNIKEKLYLSYIRYKDEIRNAILSDKLKNVSFVTRIVARSKLLIEREIYTTDIISVIEEILSSISPQPVLYISGYGDGVFRLIFINGEFKGIYINYNGKESYTEEELKNLKGKFKISVYSAKLGDILSNEE